MSERKIIDYLHLYLGCMVELDNGGGKVYNRKLIAVGGVDDEPYCKLRMGETVGGFVHGVFLKEDRIKLLLRPLSDMTEEEALEFENYIYQGFPDALSIDRDEIMKMFTGPNEYRPGFPVYVRAINWLRKKSFDVDELITDGLAIDKTTLTTQQG